MLGEVGYARGLELEDSGGFTVGQHFVGCFVVGLYWLYVICSWVVKSTFFLACMFFIWSWMFIVFFGRKYFVCS